MNIYVWKYAGPVTTEWHSGGGVMVVATNSDVARHLWEEYCREEGIKDTSALDDAPDAEYALNPLHGYSDEVMVFPDIGCC